MNHIVHRTTDFIFTVVLQYWIRLNLREETKIGFTQEDTADQLKIILASRVDALLSATAT